VEIDAFLADSVVKSGGKLHALGIGWDRLTARAFPARHARVAIGVVATVPFLDTGEEHEIVIRLEDPEGNSIPFAPAKPGAGGAPDRLRAKFSPGRPDSYVIGDERVVLLAINVDGLVFQRPGSYRFVLAAGGIEKPLTFRVAEVGG
jgi:hypothetical protein